MEREMWRMVLLVLFVVGNGLCASKNNEEVFEKLCNIAGNVSVLMEKDSGATSPLEEALYGTVGRARFNDDGTFAVNNCGLGHQMRSHFCSYKLGAGSSGHGFFADSLLGTFLCLCTEGHQNEQNLCGLGNVGDNARWTGWNHPPENLLKSVWKKIKEQCITQKRNKLSNSADWEKLESVVNNVSVSLKDVKEGYGTLGGTDTNGICSGTSQGDACVTYKANGGNEPNIPWANKIKDAIQKLNQTQSQTRSQKSAQTSHHRDSEDSSEDSAESNDDGEEEEEVEETAETIGTNNASKTSSPKKKRTKKPSNKATKKQERLSIHSLLKTAPL
ncbi:Variant surface glycoprotein [Trypanosoma congolense IL3000]|uniref:Variant surface glycoprotein n=1 Tax=Trypanosoma congolense (strain IL3000) TaxID=1068625 RepID=F9WH13_TRYCI|nr:Variant surface glycoprotein [Trypanosoma congolense IL3000]